MTTCHHDRVLELLVVAVVVLAALVVALARALHRARREVAELQSVQADLLARLEQPAPTRAAKRLVPAGRDAVKVVLETASLVREKGVTGALLSSVDELATWAQVERPALVEMARGGDGTLTLLFSDIEGSTSLNDELGDRTWVRVLAWHDRLVRARVAANEGHVIKTQGDGFMVAFTEPGQAVRCAVQVQRALETSGSRPGRVPIRVRIGIHRGDVVHVDGDVFGRNVALAARVASLAEGGEVLVTDAVVEGLEPGRAPLGDPVVVELKGLAGEHVVRPVRWTPKRVPDLLREAAEGKGGG